LKDIHQKNLVHHDFHSGNILKGIDKTSCLIADLGLCRPADKQDQKNKVYGVIPYVAPEVLDSKPYTQKSDVYSFGIIMVEILTGLPPYVVYDEEKKLYKETPHDVNLALKICGGQRPQFQIKIPQLLEDLIKNCWNSDPNQRPTANELERILRIWEQEINLKDPKETDKYFYSESGFGNDEFNYYLIRNKNSVKKTEQAHFTSQFQEAEEHNKTLPEEIKFPNYQKKIHKGAIYTSRLLSFKSLPQPQNNLSQE
jgi:serine/threonine protein kinase